jgi:hypothetical protein
LKYITQKILIFTEFFSVTIRLLAFFSAHKQSKVYKKTELSSFYVEVFERERERERLPELGEEKED